MADDPAPVVQTTVEHGDASALPEVKWFWRRFYVFVVTAAFFALVYWITGKVNDIVTLRMIARYSLWGVGLGMMLYVAGSTSTDITSLVSALRSTRKETTTSAPPPATISAAGAVSSGTEADGGELPADQRVPR